MRTFSMLCRLLAGGVVVFITCTGGSCGSNVVNNAVVVDIQGSAPFYITTDGGTTWRTDSLAHIHAIFAAACGGGGALSVCGSGPSLLHNYGVEYNSNDTGRSWTASLTTIDDSDRSMQLSRTGRLYMGVRNNVVASPDRTTWAYTSTTDPLEGGINILAISPSGANIFASSSQTRLSFVSIDSGASWTKMDDLDSFYLHGAAWADDQTLCCAGVDLDPANNKILTVVTTDRGLSWSNANLGGGAMASNPATGTVCVADLGAGIYRKIAGDTVWLSAPVSSPQRFGDIVHAYGSTWFAITAFGGIVARSNDDGQTWTVAPPLQVASIIENWRAIKFSGQVGIIVGQYAQ